WKEQRRKTARACYQPVPFSSGSATHGTEGSPKTAGRHSTGLGRTGRGQGIQSPAHQTRTTRVGSIREFPHTRRPCSQKPPPQERTAKRRKANAADAALCRRSWEQEKFRRRETMWKPKEATAGRARFARCCREECEPDRSQRNL